MLGFYLDPEFAKKLRIRYIRKENFDKKGVMVAIVEEESVQIGFSMCHKIDKWDFVKREYVKNFGLHIAIERARIWFDKAEWDTGENNKTLSWVVTIPKTIRGRLKTFIQRLQEKYPEKRFPVWATALARNYRCGIN